MSDSSFPALQKRGILIRGEVPAQFASVLSGEAVYFVAVLHRMFEATRQNLLQARVDRQRRLDAGESLKFLSKTKKIRREEWKCASIPNDLLDRRVEITGPVSAKMIINALNCGAKVFMADFEDANSPTWLNNLDGQANLRAAVAHTLEWRSPEGKVYRLNEKTATLMVRPRGWHLNENHMIVDGKPVSASLFDFGLYFFHNAHALLANGSGPYFYLPKMESHLEARLWNSVFEFSERYLGLGKVIRSTVLIETILAAFEMDEILYELREHSAGLNCFPEDGMQLLTERGFMFLRDIEVLPEAERQALRFAGYDRDSGRLLYEKPLALIINDAAEQQLVELTHWEEVANWDSHSTKYGRPRERDGTGGESNHASLLVTPDHDLFLRHGHLVDTANQHHDWANVNGVTEDFEKVPASMLLTDWHSDRDCVKLLGHARRGILAEPSTAPPVKYAKSDGGSRSAVAVCNIPDRPTAQLEADSIGRAAEEVLTKLGLPLKQKVALEFFELYGFWLGYGYLAFSRCGQDTGAVGFGVNKPHDAAYLTQTIENLGLNCTVHKCDDTHIFRICDDAWRALFSEEYGHQYAKSAGRMQLADASYLEPEKQKSAKWLAYWVWQLEKQYALAILAGLGRADGRAGKRQVVTASERFRDELVRLALHAGQSVFFAPEHEKETLDGSASVANWVVCYTENSKTCDPVLRPQRDAKYVPYKGRTWCATMPHGMLVARRAYCDQQTGVVTKATRPIFVGNCGRWDYLFSVIKKFIARPDCVMGDRAHLTMTLPFMQAYVQLLIRTCHRRGVHAMGGMAAQIPIRDNAAANEAALAKVRADKEREVRAGHDGTWVAHPGLLPIALEVFDRHMPHANQIAGPLSAAPPPKAAALVAFPRDVPITDAGVRGNVTVSLLYLEAWLRGNGCVPIHNLMEDLATAEIARSQIWQWIRHQAKTVDGKSISADYVLQLLREETDRLRSPQMFALDAAAALLKNMFTADRFPEFMSLEAYDAICKYVPSPPKL